MQILTIVCLDVFDGEKPKKMFAAECPSSQYLVRDGKTRKNRDALLTEDCFATPEEARAFFARMGYNVRIATPEGTSLGA